MAAPRDSDLPVFTYHRHSITYIGIPAVAGQAVSFDRNGISSPAIPVFGVLEFDAVAGQDVTIAVAGICQMITNSAVAVGASIGVDSTSRAIPVGAGNQIFGRALSAATAPGQKIQVLITREGTN